MPAFKVVLKVAWPEEFTAPVPMLTPLSRKVTVPPGKAAAIVPGFCTLTVAVKVTDCAGEDGLSDELTVMVVLAGLTVTATAADGELPLKLVSPP